MPTFFTASHATATSDGQAVDPACGSGHAQVAVWSPHFDDAVLDCWSVLSRHERCAVVNIFTGAPEGSFNSWYDQLNGAETPADHMRVRAIEDGEALAIAGKAPINLGLLESQYRLHQSRWLHNVFRRAPAVRVALLNLPGVQRLLYRLRELEPQELVERLARHAQGATMLCMPAGIGGHRDHLLLRQAGVLMAERGITVRLYADMPYSLRYGWPRWVHSPDAPRTPDLASLHWRWHLRALTPYIGDPIRAARIVKLTPQERALKTAAVQRYATQIKTLYAKRRQGRGRLEDHSTFAYEVYWELQPRGAAGA